MTETPFERDIRDQPAALRDFAASRMPASLREIRPGDHDRVVITGMGSSHYAGLPTWRQLVASGHQVWWVDAGQLLDTPGLITPDTLLVATSQSGASAEVEMLLDRASTKPRTVIGITNDRFSVLAERSTAVVELHSGAEATVSTKSYLNTLAAHIRLTSVLLDRPDGTGAAGAADALSDIAPAQELVDLARHAVEARDFRVAFIGNQDHAASALYAGLILKEAAKVPAEGYIGGEFRHGPLELAGPGLVTTLFGAYRDDRNPSIHRLAEDLVRSGSHVLLVGDLDVPGAITIPISQRGQLVRLAADALVAQYLAVLIATAKNIIPGAFSYASKVTTTL
jgi:glucosamine--fructose-6-phosphate aminotransferase (isomerizing)